MSPDYAAAAAGAKNNNTAVMCIGKEGSSIYNIFFAYRVQLINKNNKYKVHRQLKIAFKYSK